MKNCKKVKIIIFDIVYVAAMTAISWTVIFCVDFLRVSNKCDPLLCIPISDKSESMGKPTNEFWGIGYKIVKYKSAAPTYKIMPW